MVPSEWPSVNTVCQSGYGGCTVNQLQNPCGRNVIIALALRPSATCFSNLVSKSLYKIGNVPNVSGQFFISR